MEKGKYICPVCGFNGIDEPPYDEDLMASYKNCPCCGVEFGYDDFKLDNVTFVVAREKWLKSGAQWAQKNEKPSDWNLEEQLKNVDALEIKQLEQQLQERHKKSKLN